MGEVTTITLPDAATMQDELMASGALTPEIIPSCLVTITAPPALAVPTTPTPSGPIQLASTAPRFKATQQADRTSGINPLKLASWIFILLSFGVVMMIGYTMWQQGLRIHVTTDDATESLGTTQPANAGPFTNPPSAY